MNKDNYGEIINGEDTFKKIAFRLYNGQSVLIGWTDEGYDHRDILFTYDADVNEGISHTLIKAGENIQRGMRWSNFFVSIIDFTSFASGNLFFKESTATGNDFTPAFVNVAFPSTTLYLIL